MWHNGQRIEKYPAENLNIIRTKMWHYGHKMWHNGQNPGRQKTANWLPMEDWVIMPDWKPGRRMGPLVWRQIVGGGLRSETIVRPGWRQGRATSRS